MKPFPTRCLYGTYLAELMDNAAEEAKRLGMILRVVNGEVSDLYHVGKLLGMSLSERTKLQARNVVIALGNFHSALFENLIGNPWLPPLPLAK